MFISANIVLSIFNLGLIGGTRIVLIVWKKKNWIFILIMDKYKKVEIHWHDAFSHDRWEKIDFLINELKEGNLQYTTGFVIGENKDWIAIAATITQEQKDKAASTWYIPKKWIIKRINIK